MTLVFAWLAGVGLGAIFFGGLWWTVRQGVGSRQPALWIIGSLLLRMIVALGGFYFVSAGHWQPLVACLLGFVMARVVLTRLARSSEEIQPRPAQRGSHAS
jgi:F1F0 ATPase subunit 2